MVGRDAHGLYQYRKRKVCGKIVAQFDFEMS